MMLIGLSVLAAAFIWGSADGSDAAVTAGTAGRVSDSRVFAPPVPDGTTHLLIVTGLSGEARFAAQYRAWGEALVKMATERDGLAAEHVVWLAEREDVHALVRGRASVDNIEAQLRRLAEQVTEADRVLILFFGHGTFANGETLFNVPGRNLRATELAALLAPIRGRVAVVNTASSSGGFVRALAAPNRVVITATKTGFERNETIFGAHFVAALTGGTEADADNNGRVSLLEAFEYARLEVAREYQRTNRLQTEHALIDGVGDGQGVASAESASPHARLAAAFHIGMPGGAAAAASPELRALYATKERLEGEIAALRTRRESMPEPEYEAALEKLLVDLSLNAQAIRRIGGGL
jgi:hypothetical protein